jgi:hypothetical protein
VAAGPQFKDHSPKPIALSALDHLDWLESAEGWVWRIKPGTDRAWAEHLCQCSDQSPLFIFALLAQPSWIEFTHQLARVPFWAVNNRIVRSQWAQGCIILGFDLPATLATAV